jgi:hypothetical protein
MALRSFDDVDLPPGFRPPPPALSVSVAPPSRSRLHLVSSSTWGWEELRDYVVERIENRWGPQRRDPVREASIFKSFVGRWGADAEVISRYVFEVADGFWMGSPVTINRWTKGSDPYFATVIIQKLAS